MRFGFIVTAGDPRTAAELAAEAESAGWDGVFTWDGVALGELETFDPWVVLAAMAMRTERVALGAILTPPARRRPWKLARETTTLDRLSDGRLVLPVGLGTLDDAAFGNVGEPVDAPTRAERLDESIEILQGLWTGEPFGFEGRHYRFGPMTFRPTPVQRPRIPIWVAATLRSERSIRRALRLDGVMPQTTDVAEIRALAARVAIERGTAEYAITVEGTSDPTDPASLDRVRAFRDAGATWWIEADWNGATVERLRARIAAGPPRGRPPDVSSGGRS